MRKKILNIFLITILLTLTTTVYGFTDVENHWAKQYINEFNDANLIKGYEEDKFKPDNFITRAEVVTIINRMNGATKEASKYIPDIKREDWYYTEIRKAVESGVMQGDENGFTNPDKYITREETVVMLARAFGIDDSVFSTELFKDEKDISIWAKKYMNTFSKFNYIKGYEDNTIRPKSNITRAEIVTIMNRMFTKIATMGIYDGNISGNIIVTGKNVVLKDLIINGDLFIPEGVKETLTIRNVEVKGDLILREEINTKEIICSGRKRLLHLNNSENTNKYENREYGIEFALPNNIIAKEKWNDETINYKTKDLVVINIEKNEEYYFKNIDTLAKEEIKKVDIIYVSSEKGKIKNAEYILYVNYYNDKDNAFLIIKRDNVVYKIFFYNIVTTNLIDNVIGTLNLFETDIVKDREFIIYKNQKLNLKFYYRENYIGVDDSYNTNNIYSGDAPLKLFIQVNSITDMAEYSFDEVIYILKALAEKDGKIEETKILKDYGRNAVLFKINGEEKLIYTLYIVNGNVLYNFIFRGDKIVMNEIGEGMLKEIIESIEI